MKGMIDEKGRALLPVTMIQTGGSRLAITAWVDTAFDGELLIPRHQLEQMGYSQFGTGRAILADGSEAEIAGTIGYVDWFGAHRPVQIIASNGTLPLLGVALLDGHRLCIDYDDRSVTLD